MSIPSDPSRVSFIGPGLTFKGELVAQEDLLVQGRIEGSVRHTGHFTVGQQGAVKANIEARRITVEGVVEGDLKASESIHIRASARIRGNIFAPVVALMEGARFSGSVDMESVKPARQEAPAAPAMQAHPAQKQSA